MVLIAFDMKNLNCAVKQNPFFIAISTLNPETDLHQILFGERMKVRTKYMFNSENQT